MIVVTGATGFVGHHLLPALRARFPDKSIRILARTSPQPDVLPKGVQILLGNLEQPEIVAALVRDAQAIIHLAGNVKPDARDLHELRRVNVDGTRNLYAAAAAAGSKLFIHMSSAGVYGAPRGPNPFKEDSACRPVTAYQISKFEAETALREIDPRQITLNILRPAGIYGPGSFLELKAYKKVLAQRWSIELSGGVIVHPTHVRDVVAAIVSVLEKPARAGTVFNLGGERPILVQALFALVAGTLGVSRRRIVLSPSIAGPLGGAAEAVLALLGRPKPLLGAISRGRVFSLAVDDGRFRKQYPTVPVVSLTDGLREHTDWARAHRLLGIRAGGII